MPEKGAPATPSPSLSDTVLRTLLYLGTGTGDPFAIAPLLTDLITTYTEARMTAEQELDQAIADLKTAHAARQEAVDAFARIEAKLAEAVAGMADLGDEKADVLAMVQAARDEAADYASRHPAAPAPTPAPEPPAAG